MKERMEFGFGHKEEEPKEGELAHFCAGCPQPGVNLPANWNDDPEKWKYHRSYCGDGCFSQVHQASKTTEEDVWLKSGEGFMTERKQYAEHLATATERKDVSVRNPYSSLLLNSNRIHPFAPANVILRYHPDHLCSFVSGVVASLLPANYLQRA